MYSPNLRSFLRTEIRQTISDWEGNKEAILIAKHVLEVTLAEYDFSAADFQEGLYQIIYDETLSLLKQPKPALPDASQLELFGMSKRQAELVVQIERERVYVPSLKAYKALYGEDRITSAQISESAAHYRAEADCNTRISELLVKLSKTKGYYS